MSGYHYLNPVVKFSSPVAGQPDIICLRMGCPVHNISYVTFLLKVFILNVIIKKQSDKLRNAENSTKLPQILQISQCHERNKQGGILF